MLLQLIITNELNRRLGRDATPAEQRKAYLHIADNLGDKPTLQTLNDCMDDYMDNYYVVCDKCGGLLLRDETGEIVGPYNHYRVCTNPDCEQTAYYDANHDPHQELRTY